MKSFDVLVIGGGPAAITLAKNLGKEMNMALIRPEDHSMIYCAMPYAIEGLLETDKTLKSDKIVTDAGAKLIRETVTAVDLEGRRVSCAGGQEFGWERLVIATGAEPILPPIPGHELEGVTVFKSQRDMERIAAMVEHGVRDAVVVGAGAMRTNIEDVYAAGDCVSYYSGITGERSGGKLATNAVPMARVLADTLRGRPREYEGFFNGSATKAGELFVGGTGLKEAEARARYDAVVSYAEFTTAFPIMPTAKKVKLKLIADRQSGRILGGQVVSGEPVTDKVDQITMAIQFGITARQLLGFSYSSQPWQSFYPAHNLLVKAAEGLVAKMNAGQRVTVQG